MRVTSHDETEWTSGRSVIESMAPLWREHLGPPEVVNEAYELYRQQSLTLKPTTRRFDIINCGAGYSDATAAYHDTVEESLIVEGTCIIDGEGVFEAGDYFWRPPGWVHRSHSDTGFTAILSLEGVNPSEGSVGASRVVRPQAEAGSRAEGQLGGPGGRPRVIHRSIDDVEPVSLDAVDLPWVGVGTGRTDLRVLSEHPSTGAATVAIDLAEGTAWTGRALEHLEAQLYVMSGRLRLGEAELLAGSYVEIDAGEVGPTAEALGATRLFVKTNVVHHEDEHA